MCGAFVLKEKLSWLKAV